MATETFAPRDYEWTTSGLLSSLAFEGAKRNKPNFTTRHVVARSDPPPSIATALWILSYRAKWDPVILMWACNGDWMTNEERGELKGGPCSISLGLARELLRDQMSSWPGIFNTIFVCEVAVGVNTDMREFHSTQPEYTILIQNAIQNSRKF
jgi:hypothetical protein